MSNSPDTALQTHLGQGPDADACRGADEGSDFEGFIRDQYRGLFHFLRRRTPSDQDAEDAAQESLARLLRYRETAPQATWKSLLYRIATNIAHDQSRLAVSHRNRSHVTLDGPASVELAADSPTPEERALQAQQIARLSRAILELPPKCQKVYLLKRVHNLKRAEIARRCGISVKMVEKHLATALAHLRREVGVGDTDPF